MPTTIAAPETARLADLLERAFRGGAWHGPSLTEVLTGVDAETAAAHPVPGAHSIWEIANHAAAWTDIARRRMAGEPLGQVSLEEDWPPVPDDPSPADWKAAQEALEQAHRRLHAAVLELPDHCLDDCAAGSDPTIRGLLLGILQHQAYHAAQIVILEKAAAS